jgi:NAD-dependent oxidoreductase involved in siderophore biosynthesis
LQPAAVLNPAASRGPVGLSAFMSLSPFHLALFVAVQCVPHVLGRHDAQLTHTACVVDSIVGVTKTCCVLDGLCDSVDTHASFARVVDARMSHCITRGWLPDGICMPAPGSMYLCQLLAYADQPATHLYTTTFYSD